MNVASLSVSSSAPIFNQCVNGLYPQTNADGACFCGPENGQYMCPTFKEGTALCVGEPGKALSCGTKLTDEMDLCPITTQLRLLEGTRYCQDITSIVNCGLDGDACQAPNGGFATCQLIDTNDFQCRPHCLAGRVLNVEEDACVYPTRVQARQEQAPGPSVSARARAKARRDLLEMEERSVFARAAPSASARARAKRLLEASLDLNDDLCPKGEMACPTGADTMDAFTSGHYQCLNLKEDTDNCGICGLKCDEGTGVASSGCSLGACVAFTCKAGYRLNEDLLSGLFTCISIA